MIIEVGTYQNPKRIGFTGWVKTTKSVVFVNLDGTLTHPFDV